MWMPARSLCVETAAGVLPGKMTTMARQPARTAPGIPATVQTQAMSSKMPIEWAPAIWYTGQ